MRCVFANPVYCRVPINLVKMFTKCKKNVWWNTPKSNVVTSMVFSAKCLQNVKKIVGWVTSMRCPSKGSTFYLDRLCPSIRYSRLGDVAGKKISHHFPTSSGMVTVVTHNADNRRDRAARHPRERNRAQANTKHNKTRSRGRRDATLTLPAPCHRRRAVVAAPSSPRRARHHRHSTMATPRR